MNAVSIATAAALLAAAATVAVAQTPTQTPAQADPSSASSPHQRQATHQGTDEATTTTTQGADPSSASSPHQHQAMKDASKADTDEAMTAGATPESFVKHAALDGMTEVELAKVALQKSKNDEVKQFAQKMSQDHSQANEQLMQIAKSKGISAPTKLDAKHEAMVKSLSAKSGAAFDKAYADHMAKDHSKAVALFQAASKSSDQDIAAFAQKILPTLQEHKQMADNLRTSTGTRTASAGDSKTK
jgi:putative membrane protein